MRGFLRFLLLLVVIGAYAGQSATVQQHLHEGGERTDCATCLSQATPVTPPASTDWTPAAFFASEGRIAFRALPPSPALEPADVSFATSPPLA